MSQQSSIEWTDATWNPVRGCVKVSPGCALSELAGSVSAGVVTAYKLPRPPLFVVSREGQTATTRACDRRISLAWLSAVVWKAWAMFHRMVGARRNNLDVLRPVVGLDAVEVVRDFAFSQGPTELLLSDQPVFVDVSAHISEMVSRLLYEHVAVGSDRPTAFPVGISIARINDAHNVRVTRIVGANVS